MGSDYSGEFTLQDYVRDGYETIVEGEPLYQKMNVEVDTTYTIRYEFASKPSSTVIVDIYDVNSEGIDVKREAELTDQSGTIEYKADKTETLTLMAQVNEGKVRMNVDISEKFIPGFSPLVMAPVLVLSVAVLIRRHQKR